MEVEAEEEVEAEGSCCLVPPFQQSPFDRRNLVDWTGRSTLGMRVSNSCNTQSRDSQTIMIIRRYIPVPGIRPIALSIMINITLEGVTTRGELTRVVTWHTKPTV